MVLSVKDQYGAVRRANIERKTYLFAMPPTGSRPPAFTARVEIESRPDAVWRAVEEHHSTDPTRQAYFTDASVKEPSREDPVCRAGIAVVWKKQGTLPGLSPWEARGISFTPSTTNTVAEGIAVIYALQNFAIPRTHGDSGTRSSVIIYTDAQNVLRDLLNFPRLSRGSEAAVVYEMVKLTADLQANAVDVSFFWVPGHSNIPGHALADRVAGWCAKAA
ncbi:MAG: hypothetical protein M1821_002259 [Bathelium mastoideum]|nr:MAG: hypothetical protein M1821_002259 [Bathelium mastoideum]